MKKTVLAGLLFSLVACGTTASQTPETSEMAKATTATETPEEKLFRQQTDAVQKMCTRLIDCSKQDAKQSLSPKQLAQLDLDTVLPKAMEECNTSFQSPAMSPRQVQGIRDCLGQSFDGNCNAFSDCTTTALKPKESN